MKKFLIFKRAFSAYTKHSEFEGTYCDAILVAMKIERINNDGGYLVREPGEPLWVRGSSYQSGLDYL